MSDVRAFANESEMVDAVIASLARGSSPWAPARTATEFDYARGRTDVIVQIEVDLILALEAKLERWRIALDQAYRNTCFAHRSVVVLPMTVAVRAARCRFDFERRGIGLCGIDDAGVAMLIEPRETEPLLPSLTSRALAHLEESDTR